MRETDDVGKTLFKGNEHRRTDGAMTMEPAGSKRARILSKPDLITAIAVIVIVLLINALMLLILF